MDSSGSQESQAILDCDDFDMDEILTEFAEEENKNSVIQLSDSEDELDSLVAEFATTQSDSDKEGKKSPAKVILSSDDDEIDELLDEFDADADADDDSAKCNDVSEKVETSEICNDKSMIKSVIFCEKDTKNGMFYDCSMEIEENSESLDDLQGIEDTLSKNQNKCVLEPLQEIKSNNVSHNLSESHLPVTDLVDKDLVNNNNTDNHKVESESNVNTIKNSGNSKINSFCGGNVLKVVIKKTDIAQCFDSNNCGKNELETEETSSATNLQTLLEDTLLEIKSLNVPSLIESNLQSAFVSPQCNGDKDCSKASNDENLKTVNSSSSGVEAIKVLNVTSLCGSITTIPSSDVPENSSLDACDTGKTLTSMSNECNTSFITKTGINITVSDIIRSSILKCFPSDSEDTSPCSQETISNFEKMLSQHSHGTNEDNIVTGNKRKSILSEKKMYDNSEKKQSDPAVITIEKKNILTLEKKSLKIKNCEVIARSLDISNDSLRTNDVNSCEKNESNIIRNANSSDHTSEILNNSVITLVDVSGNTEICNGIDNSLPNSIENIKSNDENIETSNCNGLQTLSTESKKRKLETVNEIVRKKKKETSTELACSFKNSKITSSTKNKIKEVMPWVPHEKISVTKNVLDKVSLHILKKVINQNFHQQIIEADSAIEQLEENKEKLSQEIEYYHKVFKENSSSLKALYAEKSYKKPVTRNVGQYVHTRQVSHTNKNEENTMTNEVKETVTEEKQADYIKEKSSEAGSDETSLKADYIKEKSSEAGSDETSLKIGSNTPSLPSTSKCTPTSGQAVVTPVVEATPTSNVLLNSSNKLTTLKNAVILNGISKEIDKLKPGTKQFPADPNVLLPFSKFLSLLPSRNKKSSPSPHPSVSSSTSSVPLSEMRFTTSVNPQASNIHSRSVFVAPPIPKSATPPNYHASSGVLPTTSDFGISERVTGGVSRTVPVYHSKTNGPSLQKSPSVCVNYPAQPLNRPVVTTSNIIQSTCTPPFCINGATQNINHLTSTLSRINASVAQSLRLPYHPTIPHFPVYNPVTTSVNTNPSLKTLHTASNFPSPVTTSVSTNPTLKSYLTAPNFPSPTSSVSGHANSVNHTPLNLLSAMTFGNLASSKAYPITSTNSNKEGLVSSKQTTASSSNSSVPKHNYSGFKIPVPSSPGDQPSISTGKSLLPKPELKIKVKDNNKTVMLSWNLVVNNSSIEKYQIYSCHMNDSKKGPAVWKNIGNIKSMPLPMACTLQQFDDKNSYHFIVRAADGSGNVGPFSNVVSVNF